MKSAHIETRTCFTGPILVHLQSYPRGQALQQLLEGMGLREEYLEQGFLPSLRVLEEEQAGQLYRGYREYVDRC